MFLLCGLICQKKVYLGEVILMYARTKRLWRTVDAALGTLGMKEWVVSGTHQRRGQGESTLYNAVEVKDERGEMQVQIPCRVLKKETPLPSSLLQSTCGDSTWGFTRAFTLLRASGKLSEQLHGIL